MDTDESDAKIKLTVKGVTVHEGKTCLLCVSRCPTCGDEGERVTLEANDPAFAQSLAAALGDLGPVTMISDQAELEFAVWRWGWPPYDTEK